MFLLLSMRSFQEVVSYVMARLWHLTSHQRNQETKQPGTSELSSGTGLWWWWHKVGPWATRPETLASAQHKWQSINNMSFSTRPNQSQVLVPWLTRCVTLGLPFTYKTHSWTLDITCPMATRLQHWGSWRPCPDNVTPRLPTGDWTRRRHLTQAGPIAQKKVAKKVKTLTRSHSETESSWKAQEQVYLSASPTQVHRSDTI